MTDCVPAVAIWLAISPPASKREAHWPRTDGGPRNERSQVGRDTVVAVAGACRVAAGAVALSFALAPIYGVRNSHGF